MVIKYPEGFTFFNYRMEPCRIHSFNKPFNCYMVIENNNEIALNHWSESDIDHVMSKQEAMIKFDNQQKEIQRKQAETKRIEEEQYNNVHGFCDNMTALQKGKVIKSLNKVNKYTDYGTLSRKEFIYKALQNGLKPIIQHNVKYYSKKTTEGYTVKPVVYSMDAEGQYNIDITKTEYDYAQYLIQNVL